MNQKHPITEIMHRGRGKQVEPVSEASAAEIHVDPRSMGSSWSKFYDEVYNDNLGEINIEPKFDAVIMPWDADIGVKGSNIVLTGGLGPGGFGNCTCEYPSSKASNYFDIVIEPEDEFAGETLIELLNKYKIKFAVK